MLTTEQLNQLATRLNKMRTEGTLYSVYDTGERSLSSISSDVRDAADESVASEMVDVNASLANFKQLELEAIDAALRRIDENNYGICIDCGTEIGFDRLLAFPAARRCLECKNRFEQGN